MILFILAIITFLALLAINFLTVPKKLAILSATVVLLILLNFINEIQAFSESKFTDFAIALDKQKKPIKVLQKLSQNLSNRTQQSISNQLIEQQKQLTSVLAKNWQEKEYSLLYFQGLHKQRLKLILDYLKILLANSSSNQKRQIKLYKIDYKTQQCDRQCLANTFSKSSNDYYNILIAQNLEKSVDLTQLQHIYFKYNLTIIFQSLYQSFDFHQISKFVNRIKFSNNYLSKLLESQPPKTISQCSTFYTFDYHFYQASQSISLNQLCSRPLPSNSATRCLQHFIKEQNQGVPLSWVRNCLQQGARQGFYEKNGWVYLNKQYFWSGRVNRTEQKFNQTEDL